MNQLGKRIGLLALGAAAIVFIIGELQGEPLLEMFMTAVSLAVAAVPETLTVIVTLTLAYGVQKWLETCDYSSIASSRNARNCECYLF